MLEHQVQLGTTNTAGSYNTYLGRGADANANNYSNSSAVGSGATITGSNQVVLGTVNESVIIPNQVQFNCSTSQSSIVRTCCIIS